MNRTFITLSLLGAGWLFLSWVLSCYLNQGVKVSTTKFQFGLEDLLYWVIVHKDGTVVKFLYQDPSDVVKAKGSGQPRSVVHYPSRSSTSVSLSDYCRHTPNLTKPTFESVDGGLALYIADAEGIRTKQEDFDVIIDCGDVLTPWTPSWGSKATLGGDFPGIIDLLKFTSDKNPAPVNPHIYKLLQIKWWDRQAPPVGPEFWVKLYEQLEGDIGINCQGGHGRSGTALCSLMMVASPDYTPLDAIIHLRAVHCPRAIEGLAQHDYLDEVGKFLGREANIGGITEITSFKEAFEKSTKPTAIRTRQLIKEYNSLPINKVAQPSVQK